MRDIDLTKIFRNKKMKRADPSLNLGADLARVLVHDLQGRLHVDPKFKMIKIVSDAVCAKEK